MSDVLVLYPRAIVNVTAILVSGASTVAQTVDTTLYPDSVKVSLRPHHQASECEAVVNMTALPFDPRKVNGIFISVYMGIAKTATASVLGSSDFLGKDDLLFCGYADSLEVLRDGKMPQVSIKARDLSSFLRDEKNLVTRNFNGTTKVDPIPRYTDTPVGALKRILQWAQVTEDQVTINDQSTGQRATSSAMTTLVNVKGQSGRIPCKNGSTAWQVVEHVMGLNDLLITVDCSEFIIREAKNAFVPAKAQKAAVKYSFVFGANPSNDNEKETLSVTLKKKFLRNRKGVRIISFDPTQPPQSRRIVSDYPSDSALPPKVRAKLGPAKHKKTHSTSTGQSTVAPPDRDVFEVGAMGIHTKSACDALAQRIYLERSRQEMEGELVAKIWDKNLFKLRNADRINIRIRPDLETQLRNISDRNKQIDFLKNALHIDSKMAGILIDTINGKDSDQYYVRTLNHEWSGKTYQTKIDFITLIETDIPNGS